MQFNKKARTLLTIILCFLLAGVSFNCGGGGDSGSSPPDNNQTSPPDNNQTSPPDNNQTSASWQLFAVSPRNAGSRHSVWAATDDYAFAGGVDGRIFHYDGIRWSPVESFTNSTINYIWGFGIDDVYAVGDGVYHYDGNSWSLMNDSPYGWCIWGTNSDDLFVSSGNVVHHFNGSTWESTIVTDPFTLWEIWGTASDDVFIAGNGGSIFHFDGTTWSPMNSGTSDNIFEIYGFASDNVYAIGPSNSILHYDGTNWSSIDIEGTPSSIWGNSANDIYVSYYYTENSFLHYNGIEWEEVVSLDGVSASKIRGTSSKVFIVSREFGVYQSDIYTTHFFESSENIRTIAGSAEDNILLGGEWTYGLLYNGQDWQWLYPTGGPNPNFHFNFAWVLDENNIIAGDDDEIKYYNGSTWSSHRILNYGSYYNNFQDAWAHSATEGFVVGRSGLYKYTGDYWLEGMSTPTSEGLLGIWGSAMDNVYAVGENSTILHFDGLNWQLEDHPATQHLNAVWGNDPQDIYAVGDSGSILHYDGTNWSIIAEMQFSMDFNDIWGFAYDDIYVAGSEGLVHYDGSTWSVIDTGYNLELEVVWGSGPQNIFLVDSQGFVYRFSDPLHLMLHHLPF